MDVAVDDGRDERTSPGSPRTALGRQMPSGEPPETGTTGGGDSPARSGPIGALVLAWPALLGYAAVRCIGLATLWIWADARRVPFSALLADRYDSRWYLQIAEQGYDRAESLHSNMAFFPLYPWLVGVLGGSWAMDLRQAAITVSWVASLAAAWGIFAVGNRVRDRRTGVILAVLWGVLPHALVENLAYTEAIFTAFAAWALFAVLTERWLTAGVLCLIGGLTRPTASSLVAVVGVAALVALVRRRGTWWRPLVAMLLAPLGWLGFVAYVADRTGRPDGWFLIQGKGWRSSFDGGVFTWVETGRILDHPSRLQHFLIVLILLIALTLFALSVVDRQPWPLLMYSGLMLVTTIGAAGYYHSKARFLIPAFALLLPVADALAGARRSRRYAVLILLTLVSAYYGGYLMLVWTWSP
ncbi:hypothetical protein [Micromonospora siamensis]|uniref:Dolichyl-phosphate-mannose-protein mannosyltransferase n=1 Tax=Micromonospora siamensis TaxID=299152 RepID=A0A1C5HYT2_9ACTN|nr:hypothetical protein [Micromonospora siamensis]SCG51178.1 hypothetical protein GA0074704_2602 [Micromonospora siamensis]